MSRAKIAFFLPNFNGGGAEGFLVSLANALADRGYRTELIVGHATGPHRDSLSSKVRLIDLKRERTVACIPAIQRYLRHEKPAALYTTLMRANVTVLIATLLANSDVPIVIREAAATTNFRRTTRRPLRQLVLPLMAKWLYRKAHAIAAVSCETKWLVSSLSPRLTDKVVVIPNPVDVALAGARSEEHFGHAALFEAGVPVVVAAGRLEFEKRFDLLIRAFKVVSETYPNARLLLLGEGSKRTELQFLAEQLGVADRVHLMGFCPNPYPYFKHATVFALSSDTEGFPNVLAQALAVGTRVVATNCSSAISLILGNGKFGTIAERGSAASISTGILREICQLKPAETELRQHLSQFSQAEIVDRYLNLCPGIASPPHQHQHQHQHQHH